MPDDSEDWAARPGVEPAPSGDPATDPDALRAHLVGLHSRLVAVEYWLGRMIGPDGFLRVYMREHL